MCFSRSETNKERSEAEIGSVGWSTALWSALGWMRELKFSYTEYSRTFAWDKRYYENRGEVDVGLGYNFVISYQLSVISDQ